MKKLFFIGCFFLFCLNSQSQNNKCRMQGLIYEEKNGIDTILVSGARVNLINIETKSESMFISDENGMYYFDVEPEGEYKIFATPEFYFTSKVKVSTKEIDCNSLLIKPLTKDILVERIPEAFINNEKNVESVIEVNDIERLIGEWNGILTYIDYSSNDSYSMPCNLEIYSKKMNKKLTLVYKYPNEPKANNKSKFRISKDKSLLNGKNIISRKTLCGGYVEIITEYSSKDGNKRELALIRNIYIIGENRLIIRKEVRFNDTKKWIIRNKYSFVKK